MSNTFFQGGTKIFSGETKPPAPLLATGLITLVYRIFGNLKFVTDLGVFGGAESKNRIRFCPSRQD